MRECSDLHDLLLSRWPRVRSKAVDRQYGNAAPEHAPAVTVAAAHGGATVRRPWDVSIPVTITAAEARRGTTRTLYFHGTDGEPITVPVVIPAGLGSGTLLTLAGCGGIDPWGRARGDLLIPVQLVPEYRLEWWGYDARLYVKLSSRELQEGKQVLVDDPALGPVAFTVAPGSADGARMLWKGRGRGTPAGDLHVQLECLDPVPAIVTAAAAPSPAPMPWLWPALILIVAIIGVVGLVIGPQLLLGI
jgi:hypothetical protein